VGVNQEVMLDEKCDKSEHRVDLKVSFIFDE
jgi:hypothetical protein